MDNYLNLLLPVFIGLISWAIKNYLFNLINKRNELVQIEWEYRLKEIWSPLYFWSGMLLLEVNKEERAEGVRKLQEILSKAVYILPKKHFFTLFKLIEKNTSQKTTQITNEEYLKTRKYIYDQIEVLQFLLYKSSMLDDVSVRTNILYPYKYLFRMTSVLIIHLLMWALIISILFAVYALLVDGHYWALGLSGILLLYIVNVDMKQREKISKEVKKRI